MMHDLILAGTSALLGASVAVLVLTGHDILRAVLRLKAFDIVPRLRDSIASNAYAGYVVPAGFVVAIVMLASFCSPPAYAHMGQRCAAYSDLVAFMKSSAMRKIFSHNVDDGRALEWWIGKDGIYSIITRPPAPMRAAYDDGACISDPDPGPPPGGSAA